MSEQGRAEEDREMEELLALANSIEDEGIHKKILLAGKDMLKATKTIERQMALDEAQQDHEVAIFYLTEYLDRCHRLENQLFCINKIAREVGEI